MLFPVSEIAVFLGPTLAKTKASDILSADYYPPARRGDIYRIIPSGVKTIVLIDGVFHSTPSVWQREIIDALAEGIQVLGASSMGALRAAELAPFGMIGCGTIFEWYRDGIIDGDDEVVLHHGDEQSNFYPMSEPLVNIRYTLLQAVQHHGITGAQAEALIDEAKRLYYPQRSYRQLLQSQVVQNWTPLERQRLEEYIRTNRVNLKMQDAIAALKQCQTLRSDPGSLQVDDKLYSPWQSTRFFLGGFFSSNGVATGKEIIRQAIQTVDLQTELYTKLSKHYFLLQWAQQNHVVCPAEFLEEFIQQHQAEHGIDREGSWLRANGLTGNLYQSLISERALIDWITRKGPAYFGIDWNCQADDLEEGSDQWLKLSERQFLLEWAAQNGVSLPVPLAEPAIAQPMLVDWLLEKSPAYFGLAWDFYTASLNELQITGRAQHLMKKQEAVC